MKSLFLRGMLFMESLFKMTCRDVYPYMSETLDHKIPFIPRMKVKIHLALCHVCTFYRQQLETIKKLSENIGLKQEDSNEGPEFSEEKKLKIKEALKKEE
jgi:hypothetical protein